MKLNVKLKPTALLLLSIFTLLGCDSDEDLLVGSWSCKSNDDNSPGYYINELNSSFYKQDGHLYVTYGLVAEKVSDLMTSRINTDGIKFSSQFKYITKNSYTQVEEVQVSALGQRVKLTGSFSCERIE